MHKESHYEGPGYYISSARLNKAVTHSRSIVVWWMGCPRKMSERHGGGGRFWRAVGNRVRQVRRV